MAIRDFYQILAQDQEIGNTGGATEDLLDWGESPATKGGHPRPLWFEVTIKEAFAGGADRSLQVQVQTSATAGGTYATILSGPEVPTAELVVGKVIRVPYPMDGVLRAIRLNVIQTGGSAVNWTAGEYDAALTGSA